MLFAFRRIRVFQALLALIAAVCGVGAALALNLATSGGGIGAFVATIALAVVFLWAFAAAVRAPTSFLAVGDERTRIRFAGFIDTVIANSDIRAVRLVKHRPWGGIGVRTDLRGTVSLVTAFGTVAELELKSPVRVWLIPRLWRLRATKLRLSIRNPDKLVDRFARR
jgi:hypothetical protein